MEFLRFGSSIPGSYWGCCAICIIQDFSQDPDDMATIQMVSGDGGGALTNYKGEPLFAGPTYRDIFKRRIRCGTFGIEDMPNHTFFAVLTDTQIQDRPGSDWLKILKEEGFEFLRSVDNSVYTGSSVKEGEEEEGEPHLNHIFALFRNISPTSVLNPYDPPPAWTDLPGVVPETWTLLASSQNTSPTDFAKTVKKAQLSIWTENEDKVPPFYSEKELKEKFNISNPTLAGVRVQYAKPQPKHLREAEKEKMLASWKKAKERKDQKLVTPWAASSAKAAAS